MKEAFRLGIRPAVGVSHLSLQFTGYIAREGEGLEKNTENLRSGIGFMRGALVAHKSF